MIRVLLTGGGSGGHVFPLLAVADELKRFGEGDIKLYYLGPSGQFQEEFYNRNIKVYSIASSKFRRYFDVQNIIDVFRFVWSFFQALLRLYTIMPDIVFSKGGPGAFSVILAARWYRIPVVIHESDAVPGLTNRFSSYFAKRIAIAFEDARKFFPQKKTALTGNPIRRELLEGKVQGEHHMKRSLGFKEEKPLVLILGGSQGAKPINNFVFDGVRELLEYVQIYHQTGVNGFEDAPKNFEESEYRPVPSLDAKRLQEAMDAADIILSRSGAGAIAEIAVFEKPAILVPLPGSANDHQKANAYAYARVGAAEVIEEANLKPHIVLLEIKKLLEDPVKYGAMKDAARAFAKPYAAELIAKEVLTLGVKTQ